MNIHDRFAHVCDQLESSNVEELKKKLKDSEKELKALEKELVAKDKEVVKAMEVGSAAEAASKEKDKHIADLELHLTSSEAKIARLSNELEGAGQSYQQTLLTQRSRLGSRKYGSLQRVRNALVPSLHQKERFAVVNFKTQVFMNAVGQKFLESLHKEMIARYRQTPQYLADLGPVMAYFMDQAVKIAMELMECSSEQKAKYRFSTLFAQFDHAKAVTKLNIDPTLRISSPWWLPIMDKAVKEFIEADVRVENTLSELIYALPYFRQLSPAYISKLEQALYMEGIVLRTTDVEKAINEAGEEF